MRQLFSFTAACLFAINIYSQNIGIGTTVPLYKLDVRGSINTDSLYRIAGDAVLSIKGSKNIFAGVGSGTASTMGNGNTALGFQAMMGSPTASNTGSDNVAIGNSSLMSFSIGFRNTAVGSYTLLANDSGNYNTAIGTYALARNTNGNFNTAIGGDVLFNNEGGSRNSAFGFRALSLNTGGYDNTAAGYETLYGNAVGICNAALGNYSLRANISGSFNTAVGFESLYSNVSGLYNAALGIGSLRANITGRDNSGIGSYTLYNNQAGTNNAAIGYYALFENINSYNTGLGTRALQNTQNSQYNTAIGYLAGNDFNNGYNNVFVGANTDVNGAGLFNIIAMVQGTIVTSGSSTARFGNSATVSYGGWAGWSNISDGRFKKDVEENVPGIDFINKLRPVTYHLAATELDAFLHKNDTSKISPNAKQLHEQALNDKEKIRYSGFVAQEVEAAAKALGFDFSGIDAAKNENDTYGLRYAEFVVPLVKAVQELSKQNDELKKQNEELVKRIEKLELLLARKNN